MLMRGEISPLFPLKNFLFFFKKILTNHFVRGIIVLKKGARPQEERGKIMEKHCAYNLTTGEILACSTGSHLKRCVAIIAKNDREFGVRGEWIFGHKGINAIMAKANRIGRQRLGR